MIMSATTKLVGKVKKGVIALPRGLELAEGASVALIPLEALPGDTPFLKLALKLAKPRRWPRDFALNHGHYTKGHPRK